MYDAQYASFLFTFTCEITTLCMTNTTGIRCDAKINVHRMQKRENVNV
jgi:hypothetical protein